MGGRSAEVVSQTSPDTHTNESDCTKYLVQFTLKEGNLGLTVLLYSSLLRLFH